MAKSYIKNDQKNSQTATITKGGCLAGLGGLVGILILFVILKLFHGDHSVKKIKVVQQGTTKKTPTKEDKKTPTKEDKKTPTKEDKKTPTKEDKKQNPIFGKLLSQNKK